jgi:hypothetical protein
MPLFFRHFPSLPTSLARLFCPSKFHCWTVLAMLGPICFPFQWCFGLQVPVQTEYRNKAVFVSRHRSTSEHARPAPIAGQKRRCILPSSTTTHQKDHLCKSPGEQPAPAAQPTKGPTTTHPWTPTPARSAASIYPRPPPHATFLTLLFSSRSLIGIDIIPVRWDPYIYLLLLLFVAFHLCPQPVPRAVSSRI